MVLDCPIGVAIPETLFSGLTAGQVPSYWPDFGWDIKVAVDPRPSTACWWPYSNQEDELYEKEELLHLLPKMLSGNIMKKYHPSWK